MISIAPRRARSARRRPTVMRGRAAHEGRGLHQPAQTESPRQHRGRMTANSSPAGCRALSFGERGRHFG